MDTLTFAHLRTINDKRADEWTKGEKMSLSFRGNELAGETGEACNVIKKLERESMGHVGSRGTIEHLAEEVADVVICADLIAREVGFDLGEAVRRKFNKTSDKYGLSTKFSEDPQPARKAYMDGYNACERKWRTHMASVAQALAAPPTKVDVRVEAVETQSEFERSVRDLLG